MKLNEKILNLGREIDPNNFAVELIRAISNITPAPNINNHYYQFVTSGACVGDNYPRSIEIVFPKECWELHGWSSITLPISEILRWVASDSLDHESFDAIRTDFYPDEDYTSDDWDLEPDINWNPNAKRMDEIRRELAVKAELRRRQDL